MSERLTMGVLTAARVVILPEENPECPTIQEPRAEPLEITLRAMQKNPFAASKMTIVLAWVFQVRQVVWRRVASPSRRIMMHAALVSSPNWADLRRMVWSSAGWRLCRAWPIAAVWTPMAAAEME